MKIKASHVQPIIDTIKKNNTLINLMLFKKDMCEGSS